MSRVLKSVLIQCLLIWCSVTGKCFIASKNYSASRRVALLCYCASRVIFIERNFWKDSFTIYSNIIAANSSRILIYLNSDCSSCDISSRIIFRTSIFYIVESTESKMPVRSAITIVKIKWRIYTH